MRNCGSLILRVDKSEVAFNNALKYFMDTFSGVYGEQHAN